MDKKKAVLKLIEDIFGDSKLSAADCLDILIGIKDELELKIEALEAEQSQKD